MNNIQLQKQIMRRVYTICVFRTITQPALLKVYMLGIFILFSSSYVSIKNVTSNFMSVYETSFSSFVYSAFANTEIITLMLIAGALAVLFWLMKDVVVIYKHSSVAT